MEAVDNRSSNEQTTVSNIEELLSELQDFREHEYILISQKLFNELLDKYNISLQEPASDNISEIKNLGLYVKLGNDGYKLCTYYFIGAWWLEKRKTYIKVAPKEREGKFADPIAMLNEIVQDTEIANHKEFKNLFYIDTESPSIELEWEDDTFMLFLVIHYLNLLAKLVKKGLKKGFVFVEQDLNGRVKGKINIKKTYQRHMSKGIHTKTTCRFQILTHDFLDNQILKAALIQAIKFVRLMKFEISGLNEIMNYLSYLFESVSLKRVLDTDFSKVRHSPFFPEYKEALELARMILKNLGNDPFSNVSKYTTIQPYIINMPKLFELYVWLKLKGKFSRGKVIYQYNANGDIPDFIVEGKNLIVDAKYKYIDESKPSTEDIGQLSRYGRNKEVRKLALGKHIKNREPRLVIAYPTFDCFNTKCLKVEGYNKIYKVAVPIPYHDEDR
ncbi:hypothetical protein [Hydrogenivirga sp. 128-5-R1-1]|uniref:5-methylcytosine restriction system specificity protein McrC n=1 Tax=Hydrogenivirga sp. 128-5-R1-1 TaxID=392423 RepID=UPI00015F395B|nr:hypothetical protein [Hydrogenivirga sp. 128-5-R1-1]EDP75011.1 hypothetical protein HG1285_14124 [Hydrogenivirga sp. 128-5-R1-1]